MNVLLLIEKMDFQPGKVRLLLIKQELRKMKIPYVLQNYGSGTNLWVDLGEGDKRVGISCHFDIVKGVGGANDNASACLVCLELIALHKQGKLKQALRIFFFDEEENQLKGSKAYVEEKGINELQILINLELVGMGNTPLLWPFKNNKLKDPILIKFMHSIDQEVYLGETPLHSADHFHFRKAGLLAFTLTSITEADLGLLQDYLEAQTEETEQKELNKILMKSPIFKHYHKKTDKSDTICYESLMLSVDWLVKFINTT